MNTLDTTCTIRPATVNDVNAIVRVLIATKVACFASVSDHDCDVAFWTDRWNRYITSGSTARGATGDGFVYVGEIGGELVGFAAYHHTRRHGTDAELQSMYVSQHAQRLGVGTQLLQLIIDRLLIEGCKSMCVGYAPENPFRHFYLKRGATEIDPHWAVWNDVRPPR